MKFFFKSLVENLKNQQKYVLFYFILVTRSQTRKMMSAKYSDVKVVITRDADLEKLIQDCKSAKIAARRSTIAVENYVPPSFASQSSSLFKKVASKPFTRRRSIGNLLDGHNIDSNKINCNNLEIDRHYVQRPESIPTLNGETKNVTCSGNEIDIPTTSNGVSLEDVDSNEKIGNNLDSERENVTCSGNEIEIATTSNGASRKNMEMDCDILQWSDSDESFTITANSKTKNAIGVKKIIETTIDVNDESQIDRVDTNNENSSSQTFLEGLLLPFLPYIVPKNDISTTNRMAILDTTVPIASSLPPPIAPVVSSENFGLENDPGDLMWCDTNICILDSTIPKLIDLPEPIVPSCKNIKRIPELLSICNLNNSVMKKYGAAKKRSLASQLILDTLNKFELQKQSTLLDMDMDDLFMLSDISFGQYSFSDID